MVKNTKNTNCSKTIVDDDSKALARCCTATTSCGNNRCSSRNAAKPSVEDTDGAADYDVCYKSRKTGRRYSSRDALEAAEKDTNDDSSVSSRKTAAAAVDAARKEYEQVAADVNKVLADQQARYRQAYCKYHQVLSDFIDKYGSYHYSLTGIDLDTRMSHLWDDLFNW